MHNSTVFTTNELDHQYLTHNSTVFTTVLDHEYLTHNPTNTYYISSKFTYTGIYFTCIFLPALLRELLSAELA